MDKICKSAVNKLTVLEIVQAHAVFQQRPRQILGLIDAGPLVFDTTSTRAKAVYSRFVATVCKILAAKPRNSA
jgi:hypothetical protein